jgi:hypothetical protein
MKIIQPAYPSNKRAHPEVNKSSETYRMITPISAMTKGFKKYSG